MNRRDFISRSGTGTAAVAALGAGDLLASSQPVAAQAPHRTRALMKVGASTANAYDAASLNAALRYGVKNITAGPRIAEEGRLYATVDELMQMRELPEKMGMSVDVLTPPNLASSHIDRERNPGIMLGKSPERDREIEAVQTMIKNCAAAGIPCIKYNMSILGVLRTGRIPGRADTSYSHFKLADAKADPPLTRAGHVTADAYWESRAGFWSTYYSAERFPTMTRLWEAGAFDAEPDGESWRFGLQLLLDGVERLAGRHPLA